MNFLFHYKSAFEVLVIGASGITISTLSSDLTLLDVGFKCLIGAATLTFIIYKFYKETKK